MTVRDIVILRELEESDLPTLNIWRNRKEVVDQLGANFSYISPDVDKNWFENYSKQRSNNVRLAIVLKESGKYVGNVNLTNIHQINRSAEFSILIGEPDYWNKGIGSQAAEMMLEHAFNNLNLNRVFLYVLSSNKAAIRLYEKIGMQKEGLEREAVFKNGSYVDMAIMSILASEFRRREVQKQRKE